MKKPLTIGFAVALCTALGAQWAPPTKSTITTATKGGFAVMAKNSTPASKSAGIADNIQLKRSRYLRAYTKTSHGTTSVGWRHSWSHGSGVYLNDHASATNWDGKLGGDAGSAVGDSTKATFGAHSVVVAFELPENEKAVVKAYFSGYVNGGSTSKAEVDVGDNTKDVWKAAATTSKYSSQKKEFEVTGGKKPLLIRLTTETKASQADKTKGSSRASAGLTIYLVRKPKTIKCTATKYGAYASGCHTKQPVLDASTGTSGSSRWIRLNLTNAPKDAVGFFVIGAQKLAKPLALPAGGCNLHTDVLALVPIKTSSTGTSSHWLRGSSALTGAVTCQDVIIELSAKALKISTSNGLEISCKQE
ncbi:MAG: hypothetical protein ACYTGW_17790 [Planctomycetota bacterium]|jgi:hypothetical protein